MPAILFYPGQAMSVSHPWLVWNFKAASEVNEFEVGKVSGRIKHNFKNFQEDPNTFSRCPYAYGCRSHSGWCSSQYVQIWRIWWIEIPILLSIWPSRFYNYHPPYVWIKPDTYRITVPEFGPNCSSWICCRY